MTTTTEGDIVAPAAPDATPEPKAVPFDAKAVADSIANPAGDDLFIALQKPDVGDRTSAARSANATDEHLRFAFGDQRAAVRRTAAANSQASSVLIDEALGHDDEAVRAGAAANHSANVEQIERALSDASPEVRRHGAANPNALPSQMDRIRIDPDANARLSPRMVARFPHVQRCWLEISRPEFESRLKVAAWRRRYKDPIGWTAEAVARIMASDFSQPVLPPGSRQAKRLVKKLGIKPGDAFLI